MGQYLLGLKEQVRNEPGCIIWDINQSLKDPLIWVVYEAWENEDALYMHSHQPYIQKLKAYLTIFLDRYWDMDECRMVKHRANNVEVSSQKTFGVLLGRRLDLIKGSNFYWSQIFILHFIIHIKYLADLSS